jgi:hypothetical protein
MSVWASEHLDGIFHSASSLRDFDTTPPPSDWMPFESPLQSAICFFEDSPTAVPYNERVEIQVNLQSLETRFNASYYNRWTECIF